MVAKNGAVGATQVLEAGEVFALVGDIPGEADKMLGPRPRLGQHGRDIL